MMPPRIGERCPRCHHVCLREDVHGTDACTVLVGHEMWRFTDGGRHRITSSKQLKDQMKRDFIADAAEAVEVHGEDELERYAEMKKLVAGSGRLVYNQMWSRGWPTEPGRYWFYGWRSNYAHTDPPRMFPAEVHQSSNGWVYVTGASILYRDEGARGLWLPMVVPEAPTQAELEGI